MEQVYTAPRLDKLGVRPGMRVAIVGVPDDDFRAEVAERTSDLTIGPPSAGTDLVFLAADSVVELAGLADLRAALKPNGGIWIVSRKGKVATLRYDALLGVATSAGLVDNKVVAFSATHTALRFVIPVALRPKG